MTRARALVAAVPQRVWTAVAGLVLLASLGVTLVLAAGLATWQGAVDHTAPGRSTAQPPVVVVRPPGSSVIVVPTPGKSGQHLIRSVGGPAVTPGSVVVAQQPPALTPTPAPVVPPLPPLSQQPPVAQQQPPVAQQLPPTANPRALGLGSTGNAVKAQHGKAANAAKAGHGVKAGHGKNAGHGKKARDGKKAGHGKKAGPAKAKHNRSNKPKHGNPGKHLGWSKNGHGA